ncbi:MAG: hypothetical protein A2W99_07575 [Bacteroidetes bacterium GWF2_33_16]|nr:MAG: hypothetical protein A2X00_10525 [Bacteroidetes bacterium GWE2_32_14]OFY03067.1 MAG: hypothetical protein A2W99_07575 [Bacteroidetes bacterium GWF2_33_16]
MDGLPNMRYNIIIRTPENVTKKIELIHGNIGEKWPVSVIPEFETKEPIQFNWLEDGIAYLSVNSFKDCSVLDVFKSYLPELYKAKKLIVDMRRNTGGNSEIGFAILKYLTDDKFLYIHQTKSRMHIAHMKRNGSKLEPKDTINNVYNKEAFLNFQNKLYTHSDYEPFQNDLKEQRIVVPTLILTSNKTISAGEDFLVPIKQIKHIKIMGETTAGSTGTLYEYKLPESWVYICGLQSFYPDGSTFVGVGIKPDIEVQKTIRGIINLEDEILVYALKHLKELKN